MIKVSVLYIIISLVLSLKVFCNNTDTNDTGHLNPATILIFDNIPTYVRSTFPFPRVENKDDRSQVTIFDNFYEYTINPQPLTKDTVVFYQKNESIFLTFLYSMTREPLSYIINKGDTITFHFIKDVPYAKNKQTLKNEYLNYDYDRLPANKNILQHTPYEIYKNTGLVAKNINELVNNRRVVEKEYYNLARNYLNDELSFLLNFSELRSNAPEIFNLFQDKFTYQIAALDFEQHKVTTDSLNAILALNKQKPVSLSYSYFLPFLELVSDSLNVKKARFLKYKNGSETDYRDVYDKTSEWTAVNNFYKKQLLFKYLKKIGEIFSALDLQTYLSKFASFTNDTLLVKKITDEFIIYIDTVVLSKDSLFMADTKNNKFSLQTILAQNNRKVIYIDFWASWCIPCRREMKSAEKLRAFFKGKNVVFVYLSIDKSKSNWIKASAEERLNEVKQNYIITNAESSVFLKSIDFASIPRYLLYDKFGKLVHKNAPPPGSEESKQLLSNYLNK